MSNEFTTMNGRMGALLQRGISLVELILFIVIISIAATGILLVMNQTTLHSAEPIVHKQALAIAESLLEEVQLQPFTYCDMQDLNVSSANSAADCTGGAGGANDESVLPLGPETAASTGGAEGRYAAPHFDNVSDYNGFNMAAGSVLDINGNTAVAGYSSSITVAQTALNGIGAASSVLITVSVTGPDGIAVVLEGYRTRYSPSP